jgi:hypothetical protein
MSCISLPGGLDEALGVGPLQPATGVQMSAGAGAPGAPAAGSFARLLRASHDAAAGGPGPGNSAAVDPSDDADVALDPAVRHAAHLASPAQTHAPPRAHEHSSYEPAPTALAASHPAPQPVDVRAAASLEDLLPALVRNIAWNAQGHRGVVHLELGAGSLSGARLVIEADGGQVHVTIAVPSAIRASVDLSGWSERLAARLAARGLDVGSIEVA